MVPIEFEWFDFAGCYALLADETYKVVSEIVFFDHGIVVSAGNLLHFGGLRSIHSLRWTYFAVFNREGNALEHFLALFVFLDGLVGDVFLQFRVDFLGKTRSGTRTTTFWFSCSSSKFSSFSTSMSHS